MLLRNKVTQFALIFINHFISLIFIVLSKKVGTIIVPLIIPWITSTYYPLPKQNLCLFSLTFFINF